MKNIKEKMSRLQQWVNRDDGNFYQRGNRSLGWLETVFLLLLVAALVLWQVHAKVGLLYKKILLYEEDSRLRGNDRVWAQSSMSISVVFTPSAERLVVTVLSVMKRKR
jgi:hypothetical protein